MRLLTQMELTTWGQERKSTLETSEVLKTTPKMRKLYKTTLRTSECDSLTNFYILGTVTTFVHMALV